MIFDFFKRGVSKKGMFSVGIVVAFIVSITIVSMVVFVIINQTRLTEGKAFESYAYVRDEVVVGSDLFYIDASDGRNNVLKNASGFIRLSETSGAMRLDKTILRVITMRSDQVYSFGGVGRENAVLNLTGNSTYAVEFLTTADRHADNVLSIGERARIFFEFPTAVREGEQIEISLYPYNGQTETKLITVPDIIVSERVQLYP